MRASPSTAVASLLFALVVVPGCKSTRDAIGCDEQDQAVDGGGPGRAQPLRQLGRPSVYPNPFRELLGKTDGEIASKIDATFNQLFYGNSTTEAIYVPVGSDRAYILDVLHDQVRTEGIAIGMLIAVQLDKREEFDKLWRYADSMQIKEGASQGYFPSYCSAVDEDVVCSDPYGLQQIATSLLLARGRWESSPGAIDYGQKASELLDLIRNKAAYNCGIRDGVTAPFDPKRKLPYDTPEVLSANLSRPSIVMPAYYDLWHQATLDGFWADAAVAARTYWQASADPVTGLIPLKADFDGKPITDFDMFASECNRAFFAMALDQIWSGAHPWLVEESNRVLRFFYSKGLATYGQSYSLNGNTQLSSVHDTALVAANGVLASIATIPERKDFIAEVWSLSPVTGSPRYYPGILHLWALLVLSGQVRVY